MSPPYVGFLEPWPQVFPPESPAISEEEPGLSTIPWLCWGMPVWELPSLLTGRKQTAQTCNLLNTIPPTPSAYIPGPNGEGRQKIILNQNNPGFTLIANRSIHLVTQTIVETLARDGQKNGFAVLLFSGHWVKLDLARVEGLQLFPFSSSHATPMIGMRSGGGSPLECPYCMNPKVCNVVNWLGI